MPVREQSERHSTSLLEQAFYDWTKRILQLSAVALIALIVYLVYGFTSGGISNWNSLDAASQQRIAANIQGTIRYLNITLVILLLTSVILYYDEEGLGYVLIILALGLYFGVPFLVDSQMPNQVAQWEQTRNVPMLALYHEARVVAFILMVPGIGLTLYDIGRRVLAAGRGDRVDLTAMQYGGSVKKELAPTSPALIGALATCWQLPFCRESLRIRCPIYHLKRRCWRERVGCMCDEMAIRQSLSRYFDQPQGQTGNLNFATGLAEKTVDEEEGSRVPTGPQETIVRMLDIPKEFIRIPSTAGIPAAVKAERCRNCVIYNEHQRHKYQLLAPIVTLIFPVLTAVYFETLLEHLKAILSSADRVMARLSLDPQVRDVGIGAATATSDVANIIMIVCLMIVATTMALRALEYLIFTVKI